MEGIIQIQGKRELFRGKCGASQLGLVVKNPLAIAEDARNMGWILHWEDPLEKKMATAGVQPWWIQGDSKVGTESAFLEITYLITDRERLETDSVVGKLVEKRRLNDLVYVEYQSPPT